jgi:hypothetical protein
LAESASIGASHARAVEHLDRDLAVAQAYVHVEAEHDLLLSQLLLPFGEPAVALLWGDRLLLPVGEGVRASGSNPGAFPLRSLNDRAPQPQEFGTHLRERAADAGHGLHLRGKHFGRDPLAQALLRPPQHALAAGG